MPFKPKYSIFIHENEFEIVVSKMAAILVPPQYVTSISDHEVPSSPAVMRYIITRHCIIKHTNEKRTLHQCGLRTLYGDMHQGQH